MRLLFFAIVNLLLALVWSPGAAAAQDSPADRKVIVTIREDLGPELVIRALKVRQRAPGVYRIDLEADVVGYAERSRKQIRALVRQIVTHSLSELGYELDPDSRFRFLEGSGQTSELRGERPITVVMFLPNSPTPRTMRLSPRAVRQLAKGDLTRAGSEIAASLGVADTSAEILVNTRQVYLRWRNILRDNPGDEHGTPVVVYARWWGNPPPAPPPPPPHREKKTSLFKPYWAAAQFWHAEMDAAVSSGATAGARGTGTSNGRLVPEVQLGAGKFWLGYQSFSHKATLGAPFTFAGLAFPASSQLRLDLDRLQLAGKATWYESGRNRIYAMGGLDFFFADARVETPALIGNLDGFAWGPVIGLLGNFKVSRLIDFGAGVRLMLAGLGDSEVFGAELESAFAYRFPHGFQGNDAQMALGYRITDLEVSRGNGNTSANAGEIEPEYSGFFLDLRTAF